MPQLGTNFAFRATRMTESPGFAWSVFMWSAVHLRGWSFRNLPSCFARTPLCGTSYLSSLILNNGLTGGSRSKVSKKLNTWLVLYQRYRYLISHFKFFSTELNRRQTPTRAIAHISISQSQSKVQKPQEKACDPNVLVSEEPATAWDDQLDPVHKTERKQICWFLWGLLWGALLTVFKGLIQVSCSS